MAVKKINVFNVIHAVLLSVVMLTGCQPRSSIPAQQNVHSQGGAFAADVSYSGRYAVVSSLYHGVALWDLQANGLKFNWYQTPEQQTFLLFDDGVQEATADNNFVFAMDIAHDDSYAVLADKQRFSLWNISSGQNEGYWLAKQSKVKRRDDIVTRQDSSMFDVVDPDKCESPDFASGERCEVVADIRAVAVSNFGNHILLGKSDGVAVHISTATGRRLEFLGHQQILYDDASGETFHLNNAINSVDISPNGVYALSGSSDHAAYLWHTQTGQVIYKFQHDSRVVLVALDPKGRYAFTSDSKKQAKIWDLTTGKAISGLKLTSRQEIFTTARFSQNGQYLVTGAPTRKLTLWDVKTGRQLDQWLVTARKNTRPSSAVVYSAAFINNDSQIVSESSAGLSEVWNIEK